MNYLRLASRLDAVVSRLDTQAKMQMINKSMVGIVKSLDKALQSNNLERVAATMDQFEKQFENLDIQTEFVEGAMNNQATLSTPEEDVNILLQQVCHTPKACCVPLGSPCLGLEDPFKFHKSVIQCAVLTEWDPVGLVPCE